jgi:ribosomal protein L37AE/L43A
MKSCPKCKKKKFNFRVAFSSWKCYGCGYELEEPTTQVNNANIWWTYLDHKKKVEIWKEFSNQVPPLKTEG